MTVKYSTALRNAQLDAIEPRVAGNVLRIYSGAAPANITDAASGTLLASITLPADPFAAAASGSKVKAGTWSTAGASASGTAGYFRIVNTSTSETVMQGTVGTSAADLIVDNTAFVAGQAFTVTTFTIQTQEG